MKEMFGHVVTIVYITDMSHIRVQLFTVLAPCFTVGKMERGVIYYIVGVFQRVKLK